MPPRLKAEGFDVVILRGEQEYMLPTGEILLIPNEWLPLVATVSVALPHTVSFSA